MISQKWLTMTLNQLFQDNFCSLQSLGILHNLQQNSGRRPLSTRFLFRKRRLGWWQYLHLLWINWRSNSNFRRSRVLEAIDPNIETSQADLSFSVSSCTTDLVSNVKAGIRKWDWIWKPTWQGILSLSARALRVSLQKPGGTKVSYGIIEKMDNASKIEVVWSWNIVG